LTVVAISVHVGLLSNISNVTGKVNPLWATF